MLLAEIYARIPPVEGCRTGCHDCCGPVPMTSAEAAIIASPIALAPFGDGKATPTKAGCLTCVYSTSQGCSIYASRPLACRLFGAVDHAMLTCPHGAKAKNPLSKAESFALVNAARAI